MADRQPISPPRPEGVTKTISYTKVVNGRSADSERRTVDTRGCRVREAHTQHLKQCFSQSALNVSHQPKGAMLSIILSAPWCAPGQGTWAKSSIHLLQVVDPLPSAMPPGPVKAGSRSVGGTTGTPSRTPGIPVLKRRPSEANAHYCARAYTAVADFLSLRNSFCYRPSRSERTSEVQGHFL